MKKRFSYLSAVLAILIFVISVSLPVSAQELKITDTAKIFKQSSDGDWIIANVNVKEEPYNAKGDGKTDDTEAIQTALNDVEAGGIVYIPAGKYVIKGRLLIPAQCALVGDWEKPVGKAEGTILMSYYGKGNDSDYPFITMENSSSMKGISIFYPEQNAENIQKYPYSVAMYGVSCTIDRLTLYNSYNGINTHAVNGSAQHLSNIYGTPLNNAITMDINLEVSEISNVSFNQSYWANSGFDNAPRSQKQQQALLSQTKKAEVIRCGRIDDIWLWDIDIDPNIYHTGILFYRNNNENQTLQGGAYGHLAKMHKTNIVVKGTSTFDVPLDFVDQKSNASLRYEAPYGRTSDHANIVSVKQSPFLAKGDGQTDDTNAIRKAIAKVKELGGGIVYLPSGEFKITASIEVPSNVEIRGVYEGIHSAFRKKVSQINVYGSSHNAFILKSNSGLHGLSFYYPEHTPNAVKKLPPTVKGEGANIWIENTTFINSYDAIDFSSAKCDNFLVRNVWGTAMNIGIKISQGSSGGVIENTLFSYGIWLETRALHNSPSRTTLEENFVENATAYYFGNCKNITGWSVSAFGNAYGAVFEKNSGQIPSNITIYRFLLDTPQCKTSLDLKDGANLYLFGVSNGTNAGPAIKEGNITGEVHIVGQNLWGGSDNQLKSTGRVHIYNENNKFSGSSFFFQPANIKMKPVVLPSSSSTDDKGSSTTVTANSSKHSQTESLSESIQVESVSTNSQTVNVSESTPIAISSVSEQTLSTNTKQKSNPIVYLSIIIICVAIVGFVVAILEMKRRSHLSANHNSHRKDGTNL